MGECPGMRKISCMILVILAMVLSGCKMIKVENVRVEDLDYTVVREMDIPEHFDFIKDEDIPTIVERALKEGNPLYPVPKIMDKEDCAEVVRTIRGF